MIWGKTSRVAATLVALLGLCFSWIGLIGGQAIPANAAGDRIDVLIVFDGVSVPERCPLTSRLRALLSHFDRIDVRIATPARIAGEEAPDLLIYCGLQENNLREPLLKLIEASPQILWLGENVSDVYTHLPVAERIDGQTAIIYNDKKIGFPPEVSYPVVSSPEGATILADSWDLSVRRDFAWQDSRLTYIPAADAEASFLLVADFLLETLSESGVGADKPGHHVFLIIDGVNPETDPGKLTELCYVAESKGIPYAVAVTPVEGDNKNIHGVPALQEELQRAARVGARILQKGYRGGRQTADGRFLPEEFWDGLDGSPLAPEAEAAALRGIGDGLRVLAAAGLAPIAFIPPGGRMSDAGFAELSKIYSVVMVNREDGGSECGIVVPYSYRLAGGALRAYSVFVASGVSGAGDVAAEIKKASPWLAVRSTTFAITYDVNNSVHGLDALVHAFQREGFVFSDLVQQGFLLVRTSGVEVTVKGGDPVLVAQQELLPVPVSQTLGERISSGLWWLVGVLAVVILALQYSLARIRSRKRRLYEEGDNHGRQSDVD